MLLARLLAFTEILRNDASVASGRAVVRYVYWKQGETWRDESGDLPPTESVGNALTAASRSGSHFRYVNDAVAFFPVPEFDAVVVAVFPSPPRRETRTFFHELVRTCARNANNAFDADHDALTQLPNRRPLDRELRRILASPPAAGALDAVSTPGMTGANSPWMLALDLDHFKQVNDTYGHVYGDVVLKSFASRLLHSTEHFTRRYPDVRLIASRIGGEEFVVLISGIVDRDTVATLAEEIRCQTADESLPNDLEWKQFGDSALALPHPSERRVTVSLGAATSRNGAVTANPTPELKNDADAALYRAKTSGRNTVVFFDDIVKKHGRIIEHHVDTGVVAIDIGAYVDVRPGQEFLVFHPDFSGERPFILKDGRTTKKLGVYPRKQMGRIVVFDVQRDISFCDVAEQLSDPLISWWQVLEFRDRGDHAAAS